MGKIGGERKIWPFLRTGGCAGARLGPWEERTTMTATAALPSVPQRGLVWKTSFIFLHLTPPLLAAAAAAPLQPHTPGLPQTLSTFEWLSRVITKEKCVQILPRCAGTRGHHVGCRKLGRSGQVKWNRVAGVARENLQKRSAKQAQSKLEIRGTGS